MRTAKTHTLYVSGSIPDISAKLGDIAQLVEQQKRHSVNLIKRIYNEKSCK